MKLIKIFLASFIIILGVYLYANYNWGPYGKGGVVYIPEGHSLKKIAHELKKADLIRNTWSFQLLGRLRGDASKLRSGEYEFPPGVSAEAIFEKLIRGDQLIRKLTIPEGYSFGQIAQLIEEAHIATKAEVMQAFKDPKYLKKLGFPALSLEGYLYPATYHYNSRTRLEDILNKMIESFMENFDQELRDRAKQAGWTIAQVVTLASIIEKETAQVTERPLISSVFHNRLQLGMPLQSDPTVIYGISNFDGNLRRIDLLNPHPYNTYVHAGLIPGPIASPGKESLRAVLFPEQSDYLYFVSKGNGTHQFSRNLEEHNAAVRKYQSQPGS